VNSAIQLNSDAVAALLKLRAHGDGVGYVCPGLEGPRNRDWRRWFEKVVRIAKVQNFRWHDLRHTFASRLVMAGVPLRAVQTLLGHKRMETTLRYSHLGETHARSRGTPHKETNWHQNWHRANEHGNTVHLKDGVTALK